MEYDIPSEPLFVKAAELVPETVVFIPEFRDWRIGRRPAEVRVVRSVDYGRDLNIDTDAVFVRFAGSIVSCCQPDKEFQVIATPRKEA